MKKILLMICIGVMIFALSGCSKYKYNTFNENIEHGEELSSEELAEVKKKIEEKFRDFSKIKFKSDYVYNTKKRYSSIKNDITIIAFSNDIIQMKGSTKTENKQNGASASQTKDYDICFFNCEERNEIVERMQEEDEISYELMAQYSDSDENPFKCAYDYIWSDMYTFGLSFKNTTGYKNRGGYIFIGETKKENTYGDDQDKVYYLQEAQIIYIINKNYEIQEILIYEAYSSNRDIETKEMYYGENVKYESTAVQIKMSYGRKKANKKLLNILNEGYKKTLD